MEHGEYEAVLKTGEGYTSQGSNPWGSTTFFTQPPYLRCFQRFFITNSYFNLLNIFYYSPVHFTGLLRFWSQICRTFDFLIYSICIFKSCATTYCIWNTIKIWLIIRYALLKIKWHNDQITVIVFLNIHLVLKIFSSFLIKQEKEFHFAIKNHLPNILCVI